MTWQEEWGLIAGMAIVTFLVRYPLLVLVGKISLPMGVFRALRYVPVAVLTAIIAPAVVLNEGQITLMSVPMAGGIVAVMIAWRTRNLLYTIVGGMGVFLALRALGG